jgi:glycosyltransferase involved in cell wall biosynthesis
VFERCRALILPGEEDFGLTPLEANAAGRPVVALARGGALDTVRDGETGVLFDDETTESLECALRAVQQRSWDPAVLRAHAESFSEDVFIGRFQSVLAVSLQQKKLGRLGADDAA